METTTHNWKTNFIGKKVKLNLNPINTDSFKHTTILTEKYVHKHKLLSAIYWKKFQHFQQYTPKGLIRMYAVMQKNGKHHSISPESLSSQHASNQKGKKKQQ